MNLPIRTGSYAWKYGLNADAQKVGEELNAIYATNRSLTPDLVVDYARNPDSETHKLIEWDDGKAAHGFRRQQAAYIIRNIVFNREKDVQEAGTKVIPIRPWVNVVENESRHYMPLQIAFTSPDTRNQVLESALQELNAWKRKYGQLRELATIADAIEEAERQYTSIELLAA